MSDEHGWPDFAHDPGHHDHHDLGEHAAHDDAGAHVEPEPDPGWHDEPFDPGLPETGEHAVAPEEHAWAAHDQADAVHDEQPQHPVVDVTDGHAMGPVGADPDAAADAVHDPADVFPPAVDVGALPEPVDGFPWIDTGSLGVVDPVAAPAEPVTAAELAGYAAEELPPAVDPWAHLEQSQDPATSALARWWRDNG